MSSPVRPQPRPNLSAYLSQQILSLIQTRNLKPGDRLPSAKDLANHFSVATPTMREALRRLQATGVIDIRHGSGIYVRRASDRLMLSNPGYGALEVHTILQVLDARMLIEPHLAELAATHATGDDVIVLQTLLTQADDSVLQHGDGYLVANHALHVAIARTSGNLVLTHVVESLLEMYSTELHLADPGSSFAETRTRDHHYHHLVIQAITAHDRPAASAAMTQHIETARGTVQPRVSGS